MATETLEKPLTPPQLTRLIWQLPKSWKRSAGMLRHHRRALGQHLRNVQKEWEHRAPRV